MNNIHKLWARNTFWITFIVIFFVLGLWAGRAWAVTPSKVKLQGSKYQPYIHAMSATTTTTSLPVARIVRPYRSVLPVISHSDLLAGSGIPSSDWSYVELLVSKESGWNPTARNSRSGACGLPQALPCSKLGASWSNPLVALRWMDSYVRSRYKTWDQAWAHSRAYGWY